MAVSLDTLMIDVIDMDRLVAFYRDAVGLQLEMHTPAWSSFALGGGASLGLHGGRHEAGARSRNWVPGLRVDDIVAAREKALAGGASVGGEYHDIPGGVILDLVDPEGNGLEVIQHGVTCADLGVASASA
jgi:predicted enzyme related to lactoylglutathione lyase